MSLKIKVTLTVIEGDDRGKTFTLDRERTVIGRARGDLILADRKISSEHLCLTIEDDKLIVEDLASTNGTFVNEERIDQPTQLHNLDILSFGFSKCRISLVDDLENFRKVNRPGSSSKSSPKHAKKKKSKGGGGSAVKSGRQQKPTIDNLIEEELKRFSRWDIAQPESMPSFDKPLQLPKIPLELEVIEGPEKGRVIRLAKGNSIMGRGKVDVKFKDQDISRNHSSIEAFSETQIFVRDLASTNGTFVNQKRVTYSKLSDGDIIQIGGTVMRFRVKGDPE
jgi:pSer/pThr/pTyr-binding forkhead associated (FHA) protein